MATADGSAEHHETIDALLAENRTFPPPEDIKRDALVTGTFLYDEAAADDEGFWAEQARTPLLPWIGSRSPRSSTGRCRTPNGSRTADQCLRGTASTAMSRRGRATGWPTTGRGSRAKPGRSPMRTSLALTSRPPPTP